MVPRVDREWLFCTKVTSMPPAAYLSARQLSRKKPRSSRNTSGSTTVTPSSSVPINFIASLQNCAAARAAPGSSLTQDDTKKEFGQGPADFDPRPGYASIIASVVARREI